MELNKENKRILKKLIDVKETNMNVADMLLYVYQNEIHPSVDEMNEIINENHLNETNALYIWLMNELEMDLDNQNNSSLCNKYFLSNLSLEEITKYNENPYVKVLNNINIHEKNYSITTITYRPYQIFPLNDLIIDEKEYYLEHTPIGFFKEKYSYVALLHKNRIWMSLNPNEINTMEKHIQNTKGDVLVLGLGLGYFPFMCSIKEDVNSVTVIENDREIIHLYEKYISKNFDNSKIKIIESDAIEYLATNHNYDYIFADLWHDPLDGIDLYSKLRKIQTKYKLNISYWIENSIIALARRILITLIEDSHKSNIKDNLVFKEFEASKILYSALKEYDLSTAPLEEILSDYNIKRILD